jgi:hypothetical protein
MIDSRAMVLDTSANACTGPTDSLFIETSPPGDGDEYC